MRRKTLAAFVTAAAAVGLVVPWARAEGVPTRVRVRALASNAKIIGDGVGGARITLRDAATGEVLAEGIQRGKTGDTELILGPHERGATIYDTPDAAGFEATLQLERPTLVEITAEGPLGYPQALQKASKTVLLVPGQDVLGEGILLTIHGFIVEILAPTAQDEPRAGEPLLVQARVRMA